MSKIEVYLPLVNNSSYSSPSNRLPSIEPSKLLLNAQPLNKMAKSQTIQNQYFNTLKYIATIKSHIHAELALFHIVL